jgi:hypothetical protein
MFGVRTQYDVGSIIEWLGSLSYAIINLAAVTLIGTSALLSTLQYYVVASLVMVAVVNGKWNTIYACLQCHCRNFKRTSSLL